MVLALTEWATDAVTTGGPLVLALVMFVENVFPPIPSEVVLPLAGYLVEQGEMDPVSAVGASTAGSVAGAMVLYEAGRHGGRPLVLRYGRVLRVDDAALDKADGWMDRHGTKVVLGARMVPLARSVVSVPAGTTRVPRGAFILYTAVGSLLWNSALIATGWALGATWEQASGVVGTLSIVAAAASVVGGLLLWWRAQRIRRGPTGTDQDKRDRTTATAAPTSRRTASSSTDRSSRT